MGIHQCGLIVFGCRGKKSAVPLKGGGELISGGIAINIH